MATVDDLHTVALAFLDAATTALDLTPAGAPGRRYVSPGEPALDCCLPGSTLIQTSHGPIPISEVQAGDEVWAHEDGYLVQRRVMRQLTKGEQDILRIRTRNRTLCCTPDHEVLVAIPRCRERDSRGNFTPLRWEMEWRRGDAIRSGDILVSLHHLEQPDRESQLPDGTLITADVGWLLGLWIGDGCFNGREGLLWFIHNGVRARAMEIIQRTWGVVPRQDSERISLNSRELCPMFEQVFSRAHAVEKRVPSLIWGASTETKRSFLQGFAAADGDVTENQYQRYSSSSKRLLAELRGLHIELGDNVSNVWTQLRTRPIRIKGKDVIRALPLHRFACYPDSARQQTVLMDYRGLRRALPDNRLIGTSVASISREKPQETFDLQIEGAHNFIADGLVVHNCGQLTVWVQSLADADMNGGSGALASAKRINRGTQPEVTIFVQATRCVDLTTSKPTDLPDPVKLQEAAEAINRDGWALRGQLMWELRHGDLAKLCSGAEFLGGEVLVPQGGCVGWTFQFRYPVEGGVFAP